MIDVVCQHCGKSFKVKPSKIKYGCGKFCSRKCKALYARTSNEIITNENYSEIIIHSKKWGTKKAIIDNEDIEKCSMLTWQVKYCKETNSFYVASSKCNTKAIKLHRYLTDCPDGLVVDHINHNPLDNRKSNLRIITSRGNAVNLSKRKDNKSGYSAILKTKNGKFKATHSRTSLGVYDTMEEAIMMKNYYVNYVINKEVIKAQLTKDA